MRGHRLPLRNARFSPDGTRVVTASADGMARIWNAQTGQPLATLRPCATWSRTPPSAPTGTRVAAISDDGRAGLWNARTGERIAFLGRVAGDA